MKKYLLSIVFFCCVLGLISCNEIEGNGILASRTIDHSGFSKIALSLPAEVRFSISDQFSISISGESNIIEDLEAEITQDELKIDFEDNINFRYRATKPIVIYISAPQLSKLRISGAAKFVSQDTLANANLHLRASGASQIFLSAVAADQLDINLSGTSEAQVKQLQGENLSLSTSGSSEIHIGHSKTQTLKSKSSGASTIQIQSGEANEQQVSVSGSSTFRSPELRSEVVAVRASGASTVGVHAEKSLEISASGASNVSYSGNPELSTKSSGASRINKSKKKIPELAPENVDTAQGTDIHTF